MHVKQLKRGHGFEKEYGNKYMGASGDKREERNIIISEPQIFKKFF